METISTISKDVNITLMQLNSGIIEKIIKEVYNWYNIFCAWTRGDVTDNCKFIQPIKDALDEQFHVVLTDGRIMNKSNYIKRLDGLYDKRRFDPKSEIKNVNIMLINDYLAVCNFELIKDGNYPKKMDSALFRKDETAPNGVKWLYVHESVYA